MATMSLDGNVGQGTATFSETGSRSVVRGAYTDYYVSYEFTASEDTGWKFVRWERRVRSQPYNNQSGTQPWGNWGSWSRFSTSKTADLEVRSELKYSYPDLDYSGGERYEYQVRAVFVAIDYYVTVNVSSSSPANSGSVSGGGGFASGDACTVTATANVGYLFVKWTLTDDKDAAAYWTSASVTFLVTRSFDLYAHFKRAATGKLLYGSGGQLLHGSAGTLLYDGD